ncbi:hypothetical protein PSECIP111951_04067 [Pseudoalteromonas holothuriae]|uniref:Integrase catalytic domain-containing protein n=1 Tax=Pseudoalteromonas holothuriae TaxID=2963714 RepID=A0ABN8URQ6_9GAMM|nr:hypothetical protein PSECIP111951_04067 [Pseudoalteromonas sp. CIP111951]
MKTVVIERNAYGEGKHRFNQHFYQFSKEMRFIPNLCKPYRPQTKGKVERMVRYVRNDFYQPLATKLSALELTLDVETANIEVIDWLNTVANQRIHDTIKVKPADRLKEEQVYLQSLPPTQPPAPPQPIEVTMPVFDMSFETQPLHHDLNIYAQFSEAL